MLCVSTFWNHLCKQAYKSTNDNVGQTVQNYFLNVFLSCHDVMWSNFLIWCFAMTPLLQEWHHYSDQKINAVKKGFTWPRYKREEY